jgi:hypothetical protein
LSNNYRNILGCGRTQIIQFDSEDYTAYLEDKVGDKSSETRALATKLENMCKDIVPPCMITYIMQGDSFSSDNYINLGIVVVNFSEAISMTCLITIGISSDVDGRKLFNLTASITSLGFNMSECSAYGS